MKQMLACLSFAAVLMSFSLIAREEAIGSNITITAAEANQAKSAPHETEKDFFQKIDDNPATAITAIGALLAAAGAFVSFIFNYRATLRTQSDTQFFEALKRFGDKDSTTLRANAAGLLAQLGRKRIGWRNRQPYFETAFDQLLIGLQLETNFVVLDSINRSIGQLINCNRRTALGLLRSNVSTIKFSLCETIAAFFLASGISSSNDTTDTLWREISEPTAYDAITLKKMFESFQNEEAKGNLKLFARSGPVDGSETVLRLRQQIHDEANRLHSAVRTLGYALEYDRQFKLSFLDRIKYRLFHRKPRDAWGPAFLAGGDFRYRNLSRHWIQGASLRNADLRGANLCGATLFGVDLSNARLETSNLSKAYLYDVNLSSASLNKANLHRSHLGADLSNANLIEANLSKADLFGANLAGAILQKTNLRGADLRWAKGLIKNQLGEAVTDHKTRLPQDMYGG